MARLKESMHLSCGARAGAGEKLRADRADQSAFAEASRHDAATSHCIAQPLTFVHTNEDARVRCTVADALLRMHL
eukprot:scaffold225230_cov24-Tisochrysis_lutea.AAC.1